jgi:hypothetical protein
VTFLRELGVVERLIGRFKIGAAILLIGVEEELIKPAVQVVVMGDIAPRARARIELLHPAEQVARKLQWHSPLRRRDVILPQQNGQQIRDRALIEDKRAIHIGFAEA